jgi:anthranilate/para-aminobenzoate synthase component I
MCASGSIVGSYYPLGCTWLDFCLHNHAGGWVGYFSYDTVRYTEKKKLPLSAAPEDDQHLPDIHLGLYNDVVVFDHVSKVQYFPSNGSSLNLLWFVSSKLVKDLTRPFTYVSRRAENL